MTEPRRCDICGRLSSGTKEVNVWTLCPSCRREDEYLMQNYLAQLKWKIEAEKARENDRT